MHSFSLCLYLTDLFPLSLYYKDENLRSDRGPHQHGNKCQRQETRLQEER